RLIARFERPGADQRLVEEVFLVRPGASTPPTSLLKRRFNPRHLLTASFHAPGSSDRTLRRARTSSPRFVSWVAVADRANGQRRCRSAIQSCTCPGSRPNRVGSLPTSFREIRRL